MSAGDGSELGRGAEVGGSERELRLDLPAVHAAARMARQVVREFARKGGVPDDEIDTLLLISDELLTNAVDHGGGGAALEESDLVRPVRMTFALELIEGGWSMKVKDEGEGDPAEVNELIHPEGFPDLEDERGRGLFLIAQMCSRIVAEARADARGLLVRAARRYGDPR